MRKYSLYLIILLFSFPSFLTYGKEWEELPAEPSVSTEQAFSAQNTETPHSVEQPSIYFQQREFDSDFKDKYSGKRYDYDRIEKIPESKPINPPNFSIPKEVLTVLMYVLLAVLLGVVVHQIIKNSGGFAFGKAKSKIKVDYSDEHGLEDEENIENNDFETLIQKAKANKDYRRAVRYYYLLILQRLTEHKLIDWHKDKTNYDYFLELQAKPIQNDFSNSNYIYDYIWYGNFELNATEFERAESILKGTLQKLK